MRLSRLKKTVLVGTTLLLVGLAGRAAAETSPSTRRHPAAASAISTHASKPAAKPAVTTKVVKPAVTTKPVKPRKRKPPAESAANYGGGPAGSEMTTGTSAVALTFDDGPDPTQTPKLLKLLAQRHVHATFCLIGKNVQRHPEIVRQIVAGGHTLCNHTWSHSLTLGKKSAATIRTDLARTNAAIRRAAPGAEISYFRAPGGNFSTRLVAVAQQMGMTSIYWKVDPRDWDHPEGETHAAHRARVIRSVERHTHAGAIVLSHDYAQPDTIAAYRTLIPWLQRRFKLIALP